MFECERVCASIPFLYSYAFTFGLYQIYSIYILLNMWQLRIHKPNGVDPAPWNFRSRASAQFPAALAQKYVEASTSLFAPRGAGYLVHLHEACLALPPRSLQSFPRASQDGAGIYSCPDWSEPPRHVPDTFKQLRKELHAFFAQVRAPLSLRQAVSQQCNEPLFSQDEVAHMRSLWQRWATLRISMVHRNFLGRWSRANLTPLMNFSSSPQYFKTSRSRHFALASTQARRSYRCSSGHSESNCFLPVDQSESWVPDMDFKICSGYWPGAVANPELLEELLQALSLMPDMSWSFLAWRLLKPDGLK